MALLAAMGSGPLGLAAPWHRAAFIGDLRTDGAAVGAVAVLRLLVLVAGGYLLVLAALAEVARRPQLGVLSRALFRLPVPGRALVFRSIGLPAVFLGVSVLATSTSSAAPVAGSGGPAPTIAWLGPASSAGGNADSPVLRWLAPVPPVSPVPTGAAPSTTVPAWTAHPTTVPPSTVPPSTVPPSTVPSPNDLPSTVAPSTVPSSAGVPMRQVPAIAAAAPPRVTAVPSAPAAAQSARSEGARRPGGSSVLAAGGGSVVPTTYTLVPGDHLWKVAEVTMTSVLGHPPAAEALAEYWWRLVQRNRPDLPDPANPDFVLPGMTVILPPLLP